LTGFCFSVKLNGNDLNIGNYQSQFKRVNVLFQIHGAIFLQSKNIKHIFKRSQRIAGYIARLTASLCQEFERQPQYYN
jgi:hypothetical protein